MTYIFRRIALGFSFPGVQQRWLRCSTLHSNLVCTCCHSTLRLSLCHSLYPPVAGSSFRVLLEITVITEHHVLSFAKLFGRSLMLLFLGSMCRRVENTWHRICQLVPSPCGRIVQEIILPRDNGSTTKQHRASPATARDPSATAGSLPRESIPPGIRPLPEHEPIHAIKLLPNRRYLWKAFHLLGQRCVCSRQDWWLLYSFIDSVPYLAPSLRGLVRAGPARYCARHRVEFCRAEPGKVRCRCFNVASAVLYVLFGVSCLFSIVHHSVHSMLTPQFAQGTGQHLRLLEKILCHPPSRTQNLSK